MTTNDQTEIEDPSEPTEESYAEPVTVGLRAYMQRPDKAVIHGTDDTAEEETTHWPPMSEYAGSSARPHLMLVIDTETVTPETLTMSGFEAEQWAWQSQRLIIGRAIQAERNHNGRYMPRREWLFYPDDLPDEGRKTLIAAMDALPMGTGYEPKKPPHTRLYVLPQSEFLKEFYKLVCRRGALVVGFNVAFDLTRIASDVVRPRGEWRDGFSLGFWQYKHEDGTLKASKCTPRLLIKHIDAKRNMYRWTVPGARRGEDGEVKRQKRIEPNILDVKTLIFALTDEQHSLKSAAKKYLGQELDKDVEHGVITPEYVEYNRQDVLTTLELANHFIQLFDEHPVSRARGGYLSECAAYSPASMAKAYLRAMGIQPRLMVQRFPAHITGAAMTAYYGGRTEVFVREVSLPVVHLDFISEYPTGNVLMGLWRHVVAKEVRPVEATEDMRRLLEDITLADCFARASWPLFVGIALVEPDGDILPVRAPYGSSKSGSTWRIGLNQYNSGPQWYAIPDLIGSKLLTGKVPKVLKAYRFEAHGVQGTLRPVKLMGRIPIDPRSQDFFKAVIEERRKVKNGMPPYDRLSNDEPEGLSLFLKILANAGSYGIYMQITPENLPTEQSLHIYGNNEEFDTVPMGKYDKPGPYFFAPMATIITSAGRLMLAMLERCVHDAGGMHVAGDTDSMMVVADRERRIIDVIGTGRNGEGPFHQSVTALSWAEVNGIVQRFAALNPYDPDVVKGSVLEVKETNFEDSDPRKPQRRIQCYAISSKRYCLHDDDGNLVDNPKESGLGFLLNPVGNEEENAKLAEGFYEAVIRGRRYASLPCAGLPCVRQLALSTWDVYERFASYNEGKGYNQQVKPYNFLMTVATDGMHKNGDEPVQLVAPLNKDPASWWGTKWMNYHQPEEYWELSDNMWGVKDRNVMKPKIISEFLTLYLWHPEYPFLGPDGEPCGAETRGVLRRRPVQRHDVQVIGKEGLDIDEAEHDLIDAQEWPIVYRRSDAEALRLAIGVLRDMPKVAKVEVAGALSVDVSQVKRWLKGAVPRNSKAVIAHAVGYARTVLNGRGDELPDLEVLRAYEKWRTEQVCHWKAAAGEKSSYMLRRALRVSGTEAHKLKSGYIPPLPTLVKWLALL
jgi:hypothetical protein